MNSEVIGLSKIMRNPVKPSCAGPHEKAPAISPHAARPTAHLYQRKNAKGERLRQIRVMQQRIQFRGEIFGLSEQVKVVAGVVLNSPIKLLRTIVLSNLFVMGEFFKLVAWLYRNGQ
jgi:hypothetical protein